MKGETCVARWAANESYFSTAPTDENRNSVVVGTHAGEKQAMKYR